MLGPIFNSLNHHEPIEDVVKRVFANLEAAQQNNKLTDELRLAITLDMQAMVDYQMKMVECWNSLRSPMEVKSIMGLIPEYNYVNVILDNYDNPSINYAFLQWDLLTLSHLKKCVMCLRKEILEQIKVLLQEIF